MKKVIVWLAVKFATLWGSAKISQLVCYQGRLLSGTNLVSGGVGLSLRLFNVSAGDLSNAVSNDAQYALARQNSELRTSNAELKTQLDALKARLDPIAPEE